MCQLVYSISINFIKHGRRSSNPAALSFKLHIILHISSSVTAETKNISDISSLIYSLVHLLVQGISLAKDSATFTKNILNLLATIFPSLITSPLYLYFKLTGHYFRLLMTDFITCQYFLNVISMLHYQVLVVLTFSRGKMWCNPFW